MKRVMDSVLVVLKIAVAAVAVTVFVKIPGAVLILAIAAGFMYAVAVAATAAGVLIARAFRPAEEGKPASRIVAMSFCEPRSWTRVLSS